MDNINSSEQTMLDVCSGMIEMVDGIANYDENRFAQYVAIFFKQKSLQL